MKRQGFKIGLWVFTLGVLLAVLRPFVAYQLGPRINLQRLVKRKEERHEVKTEATFNAPGNTERIAVQHSRIIRLRISLVAWRAAFKKMALTTSRYIPVQHQLYRQGSCFLI